LLLDEICIMHIEFYNIMKKKMFHSKVMFIVHKVQHKRILCDSPYHQALDPSQHLVMLGWLPPCSQWTIFSIGCNKTTTNWWSFLSFSRFAYNCNQILTCHSLAITKITKVHNTRVKKWEKHIKQGGNKTKQMT
jgi:hypothetical protein